MQLFKVEVWEIISLSNSHWGYIIKIMTKISSLCLTNIMMTCDIIHSFVIYSFLKPPRCDKEDWNNSRRLESYLFAYLEM